mgnify:CR=1 FL=1|jgi:hypothetical protein
MSSGLFAYANTKDAYTKSTLALWSRKLILDFSTVKTYLNP